MAHRLGGWSSSSLELAACAQERHQAEEDHNVCVAPEQRITPGQCRICCVGEYALRSPTGKWGEGGGAGTPILFKMACKGS